MCGSMALTGRSKAANGSQRGFKISEPELLFGQTPKGMTGETRRTWTDRWDVMKMTGLGGYDGRAFPRPLPSAYHGFTAMEAVLIRVGRAQYEKTPACHKREFSCFAERKLMGKRGNGAYEIPSAAAFICRFVSYIARSARISACSSVMPPSLTKTACPQAIRRENLMSG